MDSETRSSKRILMDSDEEDEQLVEQPAEGVIKKDGAALGDLFDENDYEDIDEKENAEDPQEDEDDDAGLFGDDDEEDESASKSRSKGSDEEEEDSDENGYYGRQEQEIEIEQREMDLVIPRYPPSHVPDKNVGWFFYLFIYKLIYEANTDFWNRLTLCKYLHF